MALVVPNPTVPTNGQALDATPLLANLNAVYQAIQSFDGSQVAPGTIAAAAMAAGINPNTLLKETESPGVVSGLVWSTVSGLNATMTAGTAYIPSATSMFRVAILSVASQALTASKDIYIDVDVNGNITYNAVTNGAASPALTANSIRIAKVVTAAASITSYQQNGYDSLFNPIYAKEPSVGQAQVQSYTNSAAAGGTFYYTNIGGLKLLWGTTNSVGTTNQTVNLPTGFFANIQGGSVNATGPYVNTNVMTANFASNINVSNPTSMIFTPLLISGASPSNPYTMILIGN